VTHDREWIVRFTKVSIKDLSNKYVLDIHVCVCVCVSATKLTGAAFLVSKRNGEIMRTPHLLSQKKHLPDY